MNAGSPRPTASPASGEVRGKIVEAEIKTSSDAARPLPLICALYAIEGQDGVWLCAYYGQNRGVFDYLPQKGAEINERNLGIAFSVKEFVPRDAYQPQRWEEFKSARFLAYESH